MKILKIFGIVAGVHVLALLVIFANPGCSASKAESTAAPASAASDAPAAVPAPITADSPAPPAAAGAAPLILFSPTRPGTAAAAALETQPVAGVTPATTYTVASRDSLSSIAKKNHLKVAELAAANNLRPGSPLRVGQKLLIPAKGMAAAPADAASAAPAAAPVKPTTESVKHVVRPGETLGAIARKYGVRVGDVATANNISDPQKIHPGQELIIPGGASRAARSPAARAPKPDAAPSRASASAPPAPTAEPAPPAAPADDVPVIKVDDSGSAAPPKS